MISNTPQSYGLPARALHWLTALLIFSAIGLGLYGEGLPRDAAHTDTLKTLYSLHKTIGVAAFFTALVRILWALAQPKPVPLHPERRAETFAAEAVHWALYGAMLVMPLSGWISHAAATGFAPILWPFGQSLPFVPVSETLSHTTEIIHKLSANVLYAAIALHVMGALKHAMLDRDATLARMTRGARAGAAVAPHGGAAPAALAGLIWLAVIGAGVGLSGRLAPEAPAQAAAPTSAPTSAHAWTVTEGALTFTVAQMGAPVSGALPAWSAAIDYDPETGTGTATVEIDVTQLSLGSVTDQARGPEFFDTATHPSARFDATIRRLDGPAHDATGTLTLRGTAVPVTLPFTLEISGEAAQMTGQLILDRRAFGIGAAYGDESTVGFAVTVDVALTAQRAN